jgi:L-alanine-DL-glutamate epimerase-like enolase superfamily enzyme
MRITRLDTQRLRVPLPRQLTLPLADAPDPTGYAPAALNVLLVHLDTDAGLRGLGLTYSADGGRALQAVVEDDLAPRLLGENPLHHERLALRVRQEMPSLARGGLVAQAYAAVDLALWDVKGKAAGLPLHQLLGGCRDAAPAYAADTAGPWMSAEQVLDVARPLLAGKVQGIRVGIGHRDPQDDAHKLQLVRDAVGEDVWFGVTACQGYDAATALAMGRFLEEELDADWFEDPIDCSDLDGYARLSAKLELPVAAGSVLHAGEFQYFVQRQAAGVLRPDVLRLGGVTTFLKVAGLAETFQRPVVPHLLPEVGVHLACARMGVKAAEYVSWLKPLWTAGPELVGGLLVPPPGPGLGLELDETAVVKFRV